MAFKIALSFFLAASSASCFYIGKLHQHAYEGIYLVHSSHAIKRWITENFQTEKRTSFWMKSESNFTKLNWILSGREEIICIDEDWGARKRQEEKQMKSCERDKEFSFIQFFFSFLSFFLFAIVKHAIKFLWNILCEKYVRKLKNAMKQKWFFLRIHSYLFTHISMYFISWKYMLTKTIYQRKGFKDLMRADYAKRVCIFVCFEVLFKNHQ